MCTCAHACSVVTDGGQNFPQTNKLKLLVLLHLHENRCIDCHSTIHSFTHSLIHSFDRCYIQSHEGFRISSRRVLEYHHTLSAWTYYPILTHSLTLTHFFLPDLIYSAARCILILACSPDTSLKKALSSKHNPTQNKTE